jgi:maleate isomerase
MTAVDDGDLAGLAQGPTLGLIVPPANPTIEPEMARLIPSGARLFATRLPVLPGDLKDRNRAYLGAYEAAFADFGSLRMGAHVVGLTGPSYRLGPQGDADLVARLSARAGCPVATASAAIAAALAALGARRICLFSPYEAWLTDEAATYWSAAGFAVAQTVKVSETFRAYELTVAEVEAALGGVDMNGADAIVMSGTGMITLPAIAARVGAAGPPLLSSNLCCAWWALRTLGVKPAPFFARVAPALARALDRGAGPARPG